MLLNCGVGHSFCSYFLSPQELGFSYSSCGTQVGLVVENSPANAGDVRDTGSIPGSRKILWRRAWQPTPVTLSPPPQPQARLPRGAGRGRVGGVLGAPPTLAPLQPGLWWQAAHNEGDSRRGGCYYIKKIKSCPTLWDPMNCILSGSCVQGDSPGKNTGMSCHVLLQGIFPT